MADTIGIDEKVGETGGCGPSLFRRIIPKIKRRVGIDSGYRGGESLTVILFNYLIKLKIKKQVIGLMVQTETYV